MLKSEIIKKYYLLCDTLEEKNERNPKLAALTILAKIINPDIEEENIEDDF